LKKRRNLTVYKKAFALAMDIYHVNKKFPEKYKKPSLQIADCRLKIADLKMQSIMKLAIIKP